MRSAAQDRYKLLRNYAASRVGQIPVAVGELLDDLDQATVALQTCLHLLGEDGYIPDPDYPEVAEALALYERLVSA